MGELLKRGLGLLQTGQIPTKDAANGKEEFKWPFVPPGDEDEDE